MRSGLIILTIGILLLACSKEIEKQAPLFDDLGILEYPVTTSSELAQKYFNQGLILAYGFNHEESFRSFEEAARLDTNCAMAYWGMAYVLGPNINLPMDEGVVHTAYEAIQKAISLLDDESQKEKDLVMALSKRYSLLVMEDRTPLDRAYSDAMKNFVEKYPDDLDGGSAFVGVQQCKERDHIRQQSISDHKARQLGRIE